MAHRLLRDAQADGWERSDFPIVCESCLGDNPYIRMARAGIDYELTYGKMHPNDTILKLQRTMPCYKRNQAHVCSFYVRGECTRGAECPYRHQMPETGELSHQNIKDRYYGVNDPVAIKLLKQAGEMESVAPPEDESIKTLYVGGVDARITEQDLRDQFYAHGEIESIRMVPQRACAFVTYTTREGAEGAAEGLSNKLVIKSLRMKLMWGKPQAPKLEMEGPDYDPSRQGLVSHSGMLPRSVISQQQNSVQPQPPGTGEQPQLPYFNIPVPPPTERTFYPSMDPQRMGALVPNRESSDCKPGSDKQPQKGQPQPQENPGSAYRPPLPLQGQYPQLYPAYGYMPPLYQEQCPEYLPPASGSVGLQHYCPSGSLYQSQS